jgi:nitroreductase
MDLDKAIQSRKSVREFSSKKPNWRDIIECIDAARFAPMAGNNYTLKFIIVDDPEKIENLGVCCQQDFVKTVHYVVVVCNNPTRTINAFEESGKNYCKQQAGAAIQNFLLKIHEKGLATCWVGHFVESQIKRALTIPAEVQVEAIFPIGYETGKSKRKLKIEVDKILYFNKYKNKHMKDIKKLEV